MNQTLESKIAVPHGSTVQWNEAADGQPPMPLMEHGKANVLYETLAFWCVHVCGSEFSDRLLHLLYSSRESAFRTHLKGSDADAAFDPTDKSYSHILIVNKADGAVSAGMRMMPSCSAQHSRPADSYLEHSYPGFYETFGKKESFLELSRLFFAVDTEDKSKLYMGLFRGIRMFAKSISCNILTGLASFNHFEHQQASISYFLHAMKSPCFFDRADVPPPRYPLDLDLTLSDELKQMAAMESRIAGLERSIQRLGETTFKVSPITRIYVAFFNARVIGFSMGKSYNGLTELLIYSDLRTHKHFDHPGII